MPENNGTEKAMACGRLHGKVEEHDKTLRRMWPVIDKLDGTLNKINTRLTVVETQQDAQEAVQKKHDALLDKILWKVIVPLAAIGAPVAIVLALRGA